jgi:hypothetical protein
MVVYRGRNFNEREKRDRDQLRLSCFQGTFKEEALTLASLSSTSAFARNLDK